MVSYLVCASQRSGTELLCRGLAGTGIAGCPQEYFLAEDPAKLPGWRFWEEGPFAAGHNVTGRESYLALVYRLGSTANGVFGAKIHWNNLRWALAKFSEMPRFAGLDRAAALHRAFPSLRVVHVIRRDRVRQAVSWARMAQDGMWVAPAGQPEPPWPPPAGEPRYDYELIARLESLIAEAEDGWRRLYVELGLTPHQVVYEDLASPEGYEPAIRGVLAHLGLGDYAGPIPGPQTRRQSNDLNEAWVAAYLADAAARRISLPSISRGTVPVLGERAWKTCRWVITTSPGDPVSSTTWTGTPSISPAVPTSRRPCSGRPAPSSRRASHGR